jgi:SAM-dependent methyltransferase
VDELVVPSELCRNLVRDPVAALDAAVELIEHMCRHLGVPDLGDLDVLDFGCGVRFTEAFVNRRVPVKHYVGVDVFPPVIEFLQSNVTDPRLEYFRLDAHNALYNPAGQPLSELTVPEIEGRAFDLICLFSVFTHLAPHDYAAMLRLLRRFVKPEGRLFFTLFINEHTDAGHGYVDSIAASDNPKLEKTKALVLRPPDEVPEFLDVPMGEPLIVALYSRDHALRLIEESGWEILDVSPPDLHIQHHIVCAPKR